MDIQETQQPVVPNEIAPPAVELGPKTRLWTAIGVSWHFGIIFTLAALVLFAYGNTLQPVAADSHKWFALDNKFLILEDPRLRESTPAAVKQIFTQDYWWPKAVSGLYRPLTTLSYRFNYTTLHCEDAATGYLYINLMLQWINASLAFYIVLAVMDKLWPALLAAALFATHPISTEAVTNIIGRADLLGAAGLMAAFLLYLKSTVVTGWRKLPYLVGLAVVSTVGLLCKETAAMLIAVMVLYDQTFRLQRVHPNLFVSWAKNFWNFFITGYVFLLPGILAFWPAWPKQGFVRQSIFDKLRPPELPFVDNPLIGADFWAAKMTAIKVIGKYIFLLIYPKKLSCDYSFNQIPMFNWNLTRWEDWKAVIALATVITLLLVAIRNYRRNKPVYFFILFFFIVFLPTSNLFNFIGSIMAERFMYLPLVGFVATMVITVYALVRRLVPRLNITPWAQRMWLLVLARSVLGLAVFGYISRTAIRNFNWEDDIELWTNAIEVCPESFKTHKSLAFALYEKDPEFKDIDRVIEEAEKALNITDKAQIVFLHLGAYYRLKGDTLAQRAPNGSLIPSTQSVPWYQKSIEVLERAKPLDEDFNVENRKKELALGRKPEDIPDVGNHEIYWNLGISYMRLSQYHKALEAYLKMQHLAPANPDAYVSIASVYLSLGKLDEAAIPLLQTLLLDSNRTEAMRLLVDIYRQIDREGCSVLATTGQPKLNRDCLIVRNHICTAYYGLVKSFLEAKQRSVAERTKETALSQYHCSADAFNQLLGTKPEAGPIGNIFKN